MSANTMMPLPKQQYLGALGAPLVGGKVYTYAAGTNNPKATYADAAGAVPNENPIQLNLRGEPPAAIYWNGNYKVEVRDALGNLIYTVDNYNTDPAGVANLPTDQGAKMIGWANGGTPIKLEQALDMLYFGIANVTNPKYSGGAKMDGTDDWAALQAAIDSGARIMYVPPGRARYTKTLKGISTDTAPIKIIGAGPGSSILDFDPPAYSANNDTAMWFGNSTDNRPAPVYQCSNLTIEDLSIYVNANTRVGLRLRETLHTSMKRVFIGPEDWDSVTNLTCLFADGAVHCNFEMLDLAPRAGYTALTPNIKAFRLSNSTTLDRSAGSGSGAGFTSTSFRNCYFHTAGIIGEVYSANNVLFDACIFEAGYQGVQIYDVFLPQFNNCYFEALGTYPICVNGVDVRAVTNVVVSGGYYQANKKSGYNSDSFVLANNAGKVTVRDVQMFGQVAIGQQVTVAGTCHSIQIDAKPYSQYGTGTGNVEAAANNPFSTTAGSKEITVSQPAHGRLVGDTVGFRGFTTPVNALKVNQQYWMVTAVVDVNTFRALPVIETPNASATGAALGGAGTIVYYPPNTWVNAKIAQPNRTRFNDAEIREVAFQRAFLAAYDAQFLGLNGDPAVTEYILDKWTYVMYAYKYCSVAQGAQHLNYCYLHAKMPAGYEQDLILNLTDGSIPSGAKRGADMLMGVKLPPGTVLSVNCWAGGGVAGVTYAKTDGVRVFLAVTNDQNYSG